MEKIDEGVGLAAGEARDEEVAVLSKSPGDGDTCQDAAQAPLVVDAGASASSPISDCPSDEGECSSSDSEAPPCAPGSGRSSLTVDTATATSITIASPGPASPVSSVGLVSPSCSTALPTDATPVLPVSPAPTKRSHSAAISDNEEDTPVAKKPSLSGETAAAAPVLGGVEDVSSDDEDGDDVEQMDTEGKAGSVSAASQSTPNTDTATQDDPGVAADREIKAEPDDGARDAQARSGQCPVQHGSPGNGSGAAADGDSATRVTKSVKSGYFIRQEVVMADVWKEETESHAQIGPVTYNVNRIVNNQHSDYQLPLPENWVLINHESGGTIYMDRASRVCTWARPYYLGDHSARKHEVPVCAIPCLMQGLADNEEKKALNFPDPKLVEAQKEEMKAEAKGSGIPLPKEDEEAVAVPTIKQEKFVDYLSHRWEISKTESHCYCRHCRYLMSKPEEKQDIGELDEEKLEARLAAQKEANSWALGEVQADGSLFFKIGRKGGTQLNTAGKTPLSVLNEYCQRILRVRPEFVSGELEDPKTPFQVVVTLNGMKYGVGVGTNKKIAKQMAAELTLQALNPTVAKRLQTSNSRQAETAGLDAFEDMPVDDPGVPQLCQELGMPRPSQVLAECLRRNQHSQPMTCDLKVEVLNSRACRYKMTCGDHAVEGKCPSKKNGRQVASQAMLKMLHPHVLTWAAMMALYCDKTGFNIIQQKNEDVEDAEMQDVLQNQLKPKDVVNFEVLNELRRRMRKLIPAKDSGRPLDPKKVRQLHDFKPSSATIHPTQAPVPSSSPGSQRHRSVEGDTSPPAPRSHSPPSRSSRSSLDSSSRDHDQQLHHHHHRTHSSSDRGSRSDRYRGDNYHQRDRDYQPSRRHSSPPRSYRP
ncbi:microprocessor complex subunit DGCR8-like [Sycon ciliatum]|uniref:microprocessor complex subunit DGCR8-like n=1 Tax=Sycon ciliatum TaxID=27933 RepID=UPI0031F63536